MKAWFKAAVLFFVLAAAVSFPAYAGEIEVAADGRLRVTDAANWNKTNVTVADDVLKYGNEWKEAYRNPGKPVPVATRRTHAASGWFETTVTTSADIAIRYDTDARAVRLVRDAGVVETETRFNPFLIFVIVSSLLMLVSNVLFVRRREDAAVAAAVAAAAVAVSVAAAAAFAAAFAAAAAAFAAAVVAAVFAAFVAAVAAETSSPRLYLFFSLVFYACMALSVYLMFN